MNAGQKGSDESRTSGSTSRNGVSRDKWPISTPETVIVIPWRCLSKGGTTCIPN
jgi:hypothetical protein